VIRRAKPATSTIVFGLVLLIGLTMRVLARGSVQGQQNSDTSVIYLMARHVAHGDPRIFYWGQEYGGTLYQITAGALFKIIGSSFAGLQAVEIAYWLAACVLLRQVVSKACGLLAGDVAGALFWLSTPSLISISFSDPGFYGDGLALGLASIWVSQKAGERPGWRATTLLGLLLGLGLWTTPLTLAFTGPAALAVGLRLRSMRLVLAGVTSAVVGALPWIWANLRSSGASLHPQQGGTGSLAHRYVHFFTDVVPGLLGYTPTSTSGRTSAAVFLVIPLGALVIAAWRRNLHVSLILLPGLLVPLIVAASGVPVVPGAARYATLTLPAVAAAVGWVASRRGALIATPVLLIPIWTAVTVWHSTNGLHPVRNPEFGVQTIHLGEYLEQHRWSAVWADYWEAYLLSAATNERVIAAALAPPVFQRERTYEKAALRPKHTTVVLFADEANDKLLQVQDRLPAHRRAVFGQFAVWTFSERLDVSAFLTAISCDAACPGRTFASRG
jgi:hypothetical protein